MNAPALVSLTERIEQLTGRFEPTRQAEPSNGSDLFGTELARLTAIQKQDALGSLSGGTGLPGLTGSSTAIGLGSIGSLLAAGTSAWPSGVTGPSALVGGTASATVLDAAMAELGVPYLWGGTTSAGFDCSGLVQHAYQRAGIAMPRVSRDQARMGVEVPSLDQALPGDLVAFGQPTVDHIGIYVGNGKMIHAPKRGDVVKVGPITRPIATIRRVLTPGAPTTTFAGVDQTGSGAGVGPTTAPAHLSALFQRAGASHGVDAGLLAAVAKAESGFNPGAVSPVGAQGIMQFMPATAAQFGVDPFDPASAIDGAARYLRQLHDEFGSVELALAAYNSGPGNVRKSGGIPPFRETQNYVTKVMDTWRSAS